PAARFPSAEAALAALEPLAVAEEVAPGAAEVSPYRGLATFEAEHRALFFGRGGEAREVALRLQAEPLVLVVGDSGVGKSSLCRAGVLPLCREAAIAAGRRFLSVTVTPGRRPALALARALAGALGLDLDAVALATDPAAPTVLERLV